MTAKTRVLPPVKRAFSKTSATGAADVYCLELELNKVRNSTSASKEGRWRDNLAELLSHKKSR